jgi:hypothetical protein
MFAVADARQVYALAMALLLRQPWMMLGAHQGGRLRHQGKIDCTTQIYELV